MFFYYFITPVIKEVNQNDLFLFLNFRNQFHCLELDLKGQLNHDTGDENQFSVVHPLRPAAVVNRGGEKFHTISTVAAENGLTKD